jgi:hypothetical protein
VHADRPVRLGKRFAEAPNADERDELLDLAKAIIG